MIYMSSCEAACSINEVRKRYLEDEDEGPELRTIYGNASATEPWLDDEVARWHAIEGRANTLAFNCDKIPNVCQNMCYGAVSGSDFGHPPISKAHDEWCGYVCHSSVCSSYLISLWPSF